MRSAGTPKQLEKRRRRAGQLLKSSLALGGRAPLRSDGEFGLPRWQAYRQKGMRGLDAKPRLGRPRRLSPTEKRQLVVLYRQEWDLVGPGVELRGGRLVETRGRSVSRDGKIAPPSSSRVLSQMRRLPRRTWPCIGGRQSISSSGGREDGCQLLSAARTGRARGLRRLPPPTSAAGTAACSTARRFPAFPKSRLTPRPSRCSSLSWAVSSSPAFSAPVVRWSRTEGYTAFSSFTHLLTLPPLPGSVG